MKRRIHEAIQVWYAICGRHSLPWRNTTDPYAIYLSEIMLQQTQVKTVLDRYYFPFLAKFPTLQTLAEAHLDEVLKMWEGLGYYNRAKNLHKTAQYLSKNQTTPTLPSEIDDLIQLAGIGKNTAHAVATFAYHKPVPIMEANVKRILCRLHRLLTPRDKELWAFAYDLVDTENPFIYNQAMMDIGATLCTPQNPQCQRCPLEPICQGKDEPTRYPTKKKRIVPMREEYILLRLYDGKLALSQRQGKFLHGLWGFESVDVPLCASTYIGEVRHAYTHFKLLSKVYVYDETEKSDLDYFSPLEIEKLAISKVDEKIVKLFLDTI